MDSSRRKVLASVGSTLPLALLSTACSNKGRQSTLSLKPSNKPNFSPEEALANVGATGTGFTPQFLYKKSPNFIKLYEIGFSLHCGGTRDFFRENGKRIMQEVENGESAILFSHIARTYKEIELGVKIMSTGEEQYPDALLSVLALGIKMNRSISSKEADFFLKQAGFNMGQYVQEKNSQAGLIALRQIYKSSGAKKTPFIKESNVG